MSASNEERRLVLYQPGAYNWGGYQSPRAETVASDTTEEIGRGSGGQRNWNNWVDPWEDADFDFFGPPTNQNDRQWYNSAMENDPLFGDPGFPILEGLRGGSGIRGMYGPGPPGAGEEEFDPRDPYGFYAEEVDPFDPYGFFGGIDPMMDPFGIDPFGGGGIGFDPFMPGGGFDPFGRIDPFSGMGDPFFGNLFGGYPGMDGGPFGDPFGDPFGGGYGGMGGRLFDDPLYASSFNGGYGHGNFGSMVDPYHGIYGGIGGSSFDDPFFGGPFGGGYGGGGVGIEPDLFNDSFAGGGFTDPFLGGRGFEDLLYGGGPFGEGIPQFDDYTFSPGGGFGGFSPFEPRHHHHHHHHHQKKSPFGQPQDSPFNNNNHHRHQKQSPFGQPKNQSPFNHHHHHHHHHRPKQSPFNGNRSD